MKRYITNYPELLRQYSQRSSLFSVYPERLNCTLCHKIMIEPIQTECGCRFCLQCIGKYIDEGKILCPGCQDCNIERDRLLTDKAVEKEIMKLDMNCLNKGCADIVKLSNLADHLLICDYRSVECIKCHQWYPCTITDEHVREQCSKGMIKCGDCGQEMTREIFENEHRNYANNPDNICNMWIRDCPYRCDGEKLFGMKVHLRSCSNKPEDCTFKDIGCTFTGSNLSLKLHLERDRGSHDSLLMSQLRVLMMEKEEMKNIFSEKEESMKSEIKHSQEIIRKSSETILNLTEKVDQLQRQLQSLNDLQVSQYSNSTASNKDIVISNGQVTWTIGNIREKSRESNTGNNNNIVSERFYVTRPGYNMSLKVYLNGDGRAKDHYLSVFFVINKGDYDNELSWPFQSKVTLSLLSNSSIRKDINVHMKPDNNPACYGRPLSSNNIGAGQPEFVRLKDITNNDYYLHNGALKIRLSISSFN